MRNENVNAAMPLIEHVQEFRLHVLRSLYWLTGFSLVTFFFMKPVVTFLKGPYEEFLRTSKQQNIFQNLSSISVFEVMTVNFKVCFLIGFVLGLPFIVREIWKFVQPALYEAERKIAGMALFFSIILFYAGLCFGFFLIIPYFFANALTWASQYATVMITYESYFNSLITMMIVFAVVFEVPVILSLFGLAGLLPSVTLAKNRKIIFLICIIGGAILAPPDVISLCLVAFPMYLMAEISIHIIRKIEKRHREGPNTPL